MPFKYSKRMRIAKGNGPMELSRYLASWTTPAITPGSSWGTFTDYMLSLEPAAYWPLDNPPGTIIVPDKSGNGNAMHVNGTPAFGSAGLTSFGETALAFTGQNLTPIDPITGSGNYSLYIIQKNSTAESDGGLQYIFNTSTGGYICRTATDFLGVLYDSSGIAFSPCDTNTHQFMITGSSSFGAFYVDGSMVGKKSKPSKPITNLIISLSSTFTGTLAHAAYFDRVLSPQDAANINDVFTAGPAGYAAPFTVAISLRINGSATRFDGTTIWQSTYGQYNIKTSGNSAILTVPGASITFTQTINDGNPHVIAFSFDGTNLTARLDQNAIQSTTTTTNKIMTPHKHGIVNPPKELFGLGLPNFVGQWWILDGVNDPNGTPWLNTIDQYATQDDYIFNTPYVKTRLIPTVYNLFCTVPNPQSALVTYGPFPLTADMPTWSYPAGQAPYNNLFGATVFPGLAYTVTAPPGMTVAFLGNGPGAIAGASNYVVFAPGGVASTAYTPETGGNILNMTGNGTEQIFTYTPSTNPDNGTIVIAATVMPGNVLIKQLLDVTYTPTLTNLSGVNVTTVNDLSVLWPQQFDGNIWAGPIQFWATYYDQPRQPINPGQIVQTFPQTLTLETQIDLEYIYPPAGAVGSIDFTISDSTQFVMEYALLSSYANTAPPGLSTTNNYWIMSAEILTNDTDSCSGIFVVTDYTNQNVPMIFPYPVSPTKTLDNSSGLPTEFNVQLWINTGTPTSPVWTTPGDYVNDFYPGVWGNSVVNQPLFNWITKTLLSNLPLS